MSVTVADLMKLPSLRNARLAAGAGGLGKPVSSISVLEYAVPNVRQDELFKNIEFYGSEIVMMDDTVATAAIDFSGRPEFIFDASFTLPMIGTFPTELIRHFFRSFAAETKCNLYLSAREGGDSHHTAEALFKAFARAMRKAVRRIPGDNRVASTKGVL